VAAGDGGAGAGAGNGGWALGLTSAWERQALDARCRRTIGGSI
jgi:hypothetical protein